MQPAPRIRVMLVRHHLDRRPCDVAATQPHHGADPARHRRDLQPLARRERVEVAGDDVEAVLVLADAVEQQTDLPRATTLAPVREPRTEMQPEDPRMPALEHDLEEWMLRAEGTVPRVMRNGESAQKSRRISLPRAPVCETDLLRHARNHA